MIFIRDCVTKIIDEAPTRDQNSLSTIAFSPLHYSIYCIYVTLPVLCVCRKFTSMLYAILPTLSTIRISAIAINAVWNPPCLEYYSYAGNWLQSCMKSSLSWVLFVCRRLPSMLCEILPALSTILMSAIDFNAVWNPHCLAYYTYMVIGFNAVWNLPCPEYYTYIGDCYQCCVKSSLPWKLFVCRRLTSMLCEIFPVLSTKRMSASIPYEIHTQTSMLGYGWVVIYHYFKGVSLLTHALILV